MTTCELPREELVGYLYDEGDAERRAGIEAHIKTCPSCARALEQLGRTADLMRAWADEDPPASLVFAPEKRPWWRARWPDWRFSGNRRAWAPGLSLGLTGVVLILALLNFEADYDGQGGFHLRLSLPGTAAPDPASAVPRDPLTRADWVQAQQQSLGLMHALIREGYAQQRVELALILDQFARDLEFQRQQDLQLIAQGLQEIDGSTESRLMRTEDLLHRFLAVAYTQATPSTRSTFE